MENQDVVPLPDAAYRLGMPYRRAYERLLAGTLRGVRKDGRWFVLASELPRSGDREAAELVAP